MRAGTTRSISPSSYLASKSYHSLCVTTISPGSDANGFRFPSTPTSTSIAGHELLDEHLLVVLERELDAAAELVVVVRLA